MWYYLISRWQSAIITNAHTAQEYLSGRAHLFCQHFPPGFAIRSGLCYPRESPWLLRLIPSVNQDRFAHICTHTRPNIVSRMTSLQVSSCDPRHCVGVLPPLWRCTHEAPMLSGQQPTHNAGGKLTDFNAY